MPSAITHAATALLAGRMAARGPMPRKFWGWAMACAVLPDADVIGFAFGVRYGDFLGHRGFFHSLPFAALFGVAVAALVFREHRPGSRAFWALAAFFAVVTASHGILDGLTDGGLGIAYFSPFDQGRYFLPWRPVPVAPIGVAAFFGPWGAHVLVNETVVILAPGLLLCLAVEGIKRGVGVRPEEHP